MKAQAAYHVSYLIGVKHVLDLLRLASIFLN